MKSIVLSPGPSLATYTPQPCDFVVGVNRAAQLHRVDYWSCGDTPAIQSFNEKVIGSPTIICPRVTMDALNDHKFVWRGEFACSTDLLVPFIHPAEVNWPWCSMLVGLTFAAWKGATQIELYGADWDGKNDWDGEAAGKNRSEDRWREEKSIFGALQIVLGRRGINLQRMQPASA